MSAQKEEKRAISGTVRTWRKSEQCASRLCHPLLAKRRVRALKARYGTFREPFGVGTARLRSFERLKETYHPPWTVTIFPCRLFATIQPYRRKEILATRVLSNKWFPDRIVNVAVFKIKIINYDVRRDISILPADISKQRYKINFKIKFHNYI